jgi:glycosyltransferase 2 family protein
VTDLWARLARVGVAPLLLGATVLFLVSVPAAWRLALTLRFLHHPTGIARLWVITNVGTFFNQFLPAGMGGDAVRIWYIHRDGVPARVALSSMVVDRAAGIMALLGGVLAGLLLVGSNQRGVSAAQLLQVGSVFAALLGIALTVDLWSGPLLRAQAVARLVERIPSGPRISRGLVWAASSSRKVLLSWPTGALALALSVGNFLMSSWAAFYLAHAVGLTISFQLVFFLFPLVLLVSMLPVSLGGWGVREGAMVVLFGMVGTPPGDALAVSVLYGVCSIVSALPGGLAWLAVAHRRR